MRDMNPVQLRTLALLAATGLWLAPGPALADAMALRLATSVPLGQQPRLIITANQALDKIEVALSRDDGKPVEESFGPLEAGASHDIVFEGKAGKRHYRGRVTCVAGQRTWTSEVSFDTIVAGVLPRNSIKTLARHLGANTMRTSPARLTPSRAPTRPAAIPSR
jgi:hypothetical protein